MRYRATNTKEFASPACREGMAMSSVHVFARRRFQERCFLAAAPPIPELGRGKFVRLVSCQDGKHRCSFLPFLCVSASTGIGLAPLAELQRAVTVACRAGHFQPLRVISMGACHLTHVQLCALFQESRCCTGKSCAPVGMTDYRAAAELHSRTGFEVHAAALDPILVSACSCGSQP